MAGQEWQALARQVESLGYSTLTLGDHPALDRLGPLAAMTAAATATTTLRVGVHAFGNDYRHPVVLAKEIATIDQLSGGRVEVGLGAGWLEADYRASGITFERAGVRIARLAEAVEVIDAFLRGAPFSFRGEHYNVDGLTGRPLSVQRPRPPLMIGGGGLRLLTLAGTVADIVGLNFRLLPDGTFVGATGTRQATWEKVEMVKRAAGERMSEVELCAAVYEVHIGARLGSRESELGQTFGLTATEVRESPHFLVGSEQQVVEKLQELREQLGITYFTIPSDCTDMAAAIVGPLAGS